MKAGWRERLGPASVPVVVRSQHRVLWVMPRQKALVTAVLDGRPFRQVDLRQKLGYSAGGLVGALRSLHAMGIATVTTARGRHGWTRAKVNASASAGNVHTRATSVVSPSGERWILNVSLVRTFPSGEPIAGSAVLSRVAA